MVKETINYDVSKEANGIITALRDYDLKHDRPITVEDEIIAAASQVLELDSIKLLKLSAGESNSMLLTFEMLKDGVVISNHANGLQFTPVVTLKSNGTLGFNIAPVSTNQYINIHAYAGYGDNNHNIGITSGAAMKRNNSQTNNSDKKGLLESRPLLTKVIIGGLILSNLTFMTLFACTFKTSATVTNKLKTYDKVLEDKGIGIEDGKLYKLNN